LGADHVAECAHELRDLARYVILADGDDPRLGRLVDDEPPTGSAKVPIVSLKAKPRFKEESVQSVDFSQTRLSDRAA
jgi:hypothetical protein